MTRDLAFQILQNFNEGREITEKQLEKAAEFLQIDPKPLLFEARFKTAATKVIKSLDKTAKLSEEGLNYFSASCGYSPDYMRKVAKLMDTTPEDVIFTTLSYNKYTPHQKLAEVDPTTQDMTSVGDQGLQQDPNLLSQFKIEPHQLLSQDPFGNPLVQPTSSAPAQVPPMQNGNAEQLLENYQNKDQIEQEQLQLANQQLLAQSGQQPGSVPKEQVEQALMQASPEEKAQYAMPQGTPDQIQRMSQEIEKIEQMAGIPITDQGQLKKIMNEIVKQDKKIIDDAIKTNFGGEGEQGFGPLPGSQDTSQNLSQQTTQTPSNEQDLGVKLAKIKWRF